MHSRVSSTTPLVTTTCKGRDANPVPPSSGRGSGGRPLTCLRRRDWHYGAGPEDSQRRHGLVARSFGRVAVVRRLRHGLRDEPVPHRSRGPVPTGRGPSTSRGRTRRNIATQTPSWTVVSVYSKTVWSSISSETEYFSTF